MTRPDATSPVPDKNRRDEADALPDVDPVETQGGDAEAEPQPEPWTPERVTYWNSYYDRYVLGSVLLLAFIASAVLTSHSPLWSHLRMGREIIARGTPLFGDPFSYTEEGKTWVNIPWLFQVASAGLYSGAYGLVPEAPDDPSANRASAEQIAVGSLVALTALLRMLTAFLLIRVRHKGPGLWWAAVCTTLALGAMVGPTGLMIGGVGQPGVVGPSTWGVFFLACELLLVWRGFGQSRRGYLFALPPLFVLWANVDDSFLFGLLALAATAVGAILDGGRSKPGVPAPAGDGGEKERPAIPAGFGLAILAASALAVLANPSHVMIYPAAMEPILSFFRTVDIPTPPDQFSFFGKAVRTLYPSDWQYLALFYVVTVAAAAATFVLNSARFYWTRFLPFAFAAFAWAVYMRYGAEFAAVAATIAATNGQEWYLRKFGSAGRLGGGWTVWSTGGRLVTLAVVFACVSTAITGWGKAPGDARFGFGFDPNDFPFKAAEYLAARDDIKGNVFNWSATQGDALVWKAGPVRRTFLDNRPHLFPDSVLEQQRKLLNALRDDDPAVWKPIFDERKVSAVMVDAESAVNTQRRLSQSPNWIPFYDDGRVVMFGRSDAADPDLTTFRTNRLDPEQRAYRLASPTPPADRPPTPVDWSDTIRQGRALTPPRVENNAARRWLSGATNPDGTPAPPDPARCLLAIRQARAAVSQNPDDYTAYRLLTIAYRALAQQEAAILSGIELKPENRDRIAALKPGGPLMMERLRQITTSLNYAIQTTPPPRNADERRELMTLQFDLFDAYSQVGFVDLARDQLRACLDSAMAGDLPSEARLQYQTQLEQLNQQVSQIEQAASNLQIERQAGPIDLGEFARTQGAAGLAIIQFEDANRSNLSPTVVRPRLLDLYCSTGQPERALEVITPSGGVDPNLGDPATSAFRQGLVYKLMGNYSYASLLWQSQALPRLAYERTSKAIGVAGRSMHGDLIAATNDGSSVMDLVGRQANWEFDLAQCLLEWGEPEQAAVHYARSLELTPDLSLRPLIAYYLEKIGKPVPPREAAPATGEAAPAAKPEEATPAAPPAEPASAPTPAPAEADAAKPEAAKADAPKQP